MQLRLWNSCSELKQDAKALLKDVSMSQKVYSSEKNVAEELRKICALGVFPAEELTAIRDEYNILNRERVALQQRKALRKKVGSVGSGGSASRRSSKSSKSSNSTVSYKSTKKSSRGRGQRRKAPSARKADVGDDEDEDDSDSDNLDSDSEIKIILRLLRLTADLSNEPRKVPHKSFYLR